jgi:uncharacterized membrane protein
VAGKILTLEEAVVAAVQSAELKTSGEIRVHLSRNPLAGDAMREAQRIFTKLKMDQTKDHNGVLLYINLNQQRFAFYGDSAIHEKVGQSFWDDLAGSFLQTMKSGGLVRALEHVVDQVGIELSRHFPRQADDKNELEDTLSTD